MHLQDRKMMDNGNSSSEIGAALQDRVVQESMGPIYDRTQEHIETSDKAVIFYLKEPQPRVEALNRMAWIYMSALVTQSPTRMLATVTHS